MRHLLRITALCALAGLWSQSTAANELGTLLQTCAACHGEKGDKSLLPTYPIIAGQYASYLEHALRDYRSGARRNLVMNAQAAGLSDAEIRALSRFYAQQESPLYTPEYGQP